MITDNKVVYSQPFEKGTLGSETYRIPAICTLNDGCVIAAADMRYGHGSDSPNNIDTLVAISDDGYTGWRYKVVNYFDDYADTETAKASASFIDSAIVQSENGRIFLITDAWTENGGYMTTRKGSGFVEKNGKKHLLLTTGSGNDDLSTFEYYLGESENGFSPVLRLSDDSFAGFTVDSEHRIYKNGAPLYQDQIGTDKKVRQNVFYEHSCLSAYRTCYLWLRYSDDNGRSWSAPVNISADIKRDNEGFVGICPGRGITTKVNGKERVIFCVYDNNGIKGFSENVSTIYSDDNGLTWHRGETTKKRLAVGKTSETQIVAMPNGSLRMFARNAFSFVAFADSFDGGVTWSTFRCDKNLPSNGNCMVSFINTTKKINGKDVILGSYPSDQDKRADGVVAVGTVEADGSISWIHKYHVNNGFFAYSCLTELADGNFGYLYEDEPAHISYMVFSLSETGIISEINGNNSGYSYNPDDVTKLKNKLRNVLVGILSFLNLM